MAIIMIVAMMPSNYRTVTTVLLKDRSDYPGIANAMYKDDDILNSLQTTPFFNPTYVATVSGTHTNMYSLVTHSDMQHYKDIENNLSRMKANVDGCLSHD